MSICVLCAELRWMIHTVQNHLKFLQKQKGKKKGPRGAQTAEGPKAYGTGAHQDGPVKWHCSSRLFAPGTVHWIFFCFSTTAVFSCSTGKYLIPTRSPTLLITSNPLMRSSLEWEAEIHILALASRSGVAGNATVTTATFCLRHSLENAGILAGL